MALIWFYCHANKPYFDNIAFALGLVTKERIFGSRKCLYTAKFLKPLSLFWQSNCSGIRISSITSCYPSQLCRCVRRELKHVSPLLFLCAVSLKRHCKCNFFALKVHGSSPPLLWKCSCFSGQIWFWKCWVWGEGKSRVPGEKSLHNIELIMERFRVLENKQIKTAQNKSYR